MNRPLLKTLRPLLVLAVLGALPALARAFETAPWSHRQEIPAEPAGFTKLLLPADTLDRARADLADLRVLDADGRETPFVILHPPAPRPTSITPASVNVRLTQRATFITVATGTRRPLGSITLETPAPTFLKPVYTEFSENGTDWKTIAEEIPIFREGDSSQLTIPLPNRSTPWVRVLLDNVYSAPIPITGATLTASDFQRPVTEPVAVRIVSREELPGETVLTLDLGAKHLIRPSLIFFISGAFNRAVTVHCRDVQPDAVTERLLARSWIYHVFTPAADRSAEQLTVPLTLTTTTRELIVRIDNGDSPPLVIDGVQARRSPVWLAFNRTTATPYTLLSGRPAVTAPRYDFPAFSSDHPVSAARIGPLAENPAYLPPPPAPGLDSSGAPLNPQGWAWRKPVRVTTPGVQQLELDLDVLADAQPSLGDLRLVHAGNQIPYLLERTARVRPLPLAPVLTGDPRKPSISHWKLPLPRTGLPLTRLTVTSSTPLFQRDFRLYERLVDSRGETIEHTLATASWTHTPERPDSTLTLTLATPPRTDTLWLATDNADNPPLVLAGAVAWHPVTRLLFNVRPGETPALYYGNPAVNAPRYDVALISGHFSTAAKNIPVLGPSENVVTSNPSPDTFLARRGGIVFWGALGLVVVLLLVIVARLLPKSP